MGAIGEFAAELEKAAEKVRAGLALDVARRQAVVFLGIEKHLTPARSGRLRDSEQVDSVSGGGDNAVAMVSPHTRYAAFRENGGTITKHSPGSLGTPAVGWFGHSVYQSGSHYVARAEAQAAGVLPAVAAAVADELLGGL